MNDDELSKLRHALRNKINTISINAELIRLLIQSGKSPEQIIVSVERILQECKNSSGLLDAADPAPDAAENL